MRAYGWRLPSSSFSMLAAAPPLTALLLQEQRGASAKAQLMELANDQLGLLAALAGTFLV